MATDDPINKAKEFLEQNKEKLDKVLHGEQAEQVTDSMINAAADFIKKLTPDEHDAKIDEVRANVDRSLGSE